MPSAGLGLPWIDRALLPKLMFDWEMRSYAMPNKQDGPVFFDRGLPDTSAICVSKACRPRGGKAAELQPARLRLAALAIVGIEAGV